MRTGNEDNSGRNRVVSKPMDCIVKLKSLRSSEGPSIDNVTACLRRDGFVFIDFEEDEICSFFPFVNEAGAFLQDEGRGKGASPTKALEGHLSSRLKDSISLVTGNQLEASALKLPSIFIDNAQKLGHALDAASTDVVSALAWPLFGIRDENGLEGVGKTFEIPLLKSGLEKSYGIVDIVCYHNNEGTPDILVSSHKDPGLLTLSLPQSSPGLELLKGGGNAGGEWISAPKSCGVLWAGDRAAEHGLCKPGIHRVRKGVGPRISCWHELCTATQLSSPVLADLTKRGEACTQEVIKLLRQAEEHNTNAVEFIEFIGVTEGGGVPIGKIEYANFHVAIRRAKQKENKGFGPWRLQKLLR